MQPNITKTHSDSAISDLKAAMADLKVSTLVFCLIIVIAAVLS